MNPVRPYRVGFVVTHPIQYLAPFFAYATREAGLQMVGLYLSDVSLRGEVDSGFKRSVKWDIDLLDGYEAQFMGPAAHTRKMSGFFSMIAPELWSAIRNGRFDAIIIHGHNFAAHHVALAAAKSANIPVFARADTNVLLKRPAWKDSVRRSILEPWYKNFDGMLAIGTRNAEYYRSMGVHADRIFFAPFCVDNERFGVSTLTDRETRAQTRRMLGVIDTTPIIVFSGKLDQGKRPQDLIRAFEKMRKNGVDGWLVMVGSGQLNDELRSLVLQLNLSNVLFPGFINQSELPSMYGASDVFVLPSSKEAWGLAVNEAMCAGLPIVVSEEVGCAIDLVDPGENGFTFPAGDVDALSEALSVLCSDHQRRREMG